MLKQYDELNRLHHRGLHGTYLLQDVDHTITSYEHQVASMIKSAEAAQEAVRDQCSKDLLLVWLTRAQFEKLLDMKQKQANIVEAHLQREQTEVAAEQSRSVMIFVGQSTLSYRIFCAKANSSIVDDFYNHIFTPEFFCICVWYQCAGMERYFHEPDLPYHFPLHGLPVSSGHHHCFTGRF